MPQGTAIRSSSRPRVFIGSSTEGKEVAQRLQAQMMDFCDAELWSDGFFHLGDANVESLLVASTEVDYAALVLSADDLTERRGVTGHVPRDNVIFELGLFTGALGRHRTFAVFCQDDQVVLPSDWTVTSAVYRRIKSGNLASALVPAALAIRDAITRGEERKRAIASDALPDRNQIAVRNQAVRYVHDALETFANGIAGAQRGATDRVLLERWMQNVFGMVFDLFEDRQPDVYAAWLRPSPSAPKRLKVSRQRNLPADYQHYEYVIGEGLVGKVWSHGTPAAISEMRAHPWWVYREGCDNVTYLAAPVGSSDTTGGVLAIGSDLGFAIEDVDLEALVLLADVLALGVDLPIRAGDAPQESI